MSQASGRQWKEPGQRAGALKSQNVSSSWEAKMRNKAETKIFRENRAEAIAVRKAKLQVLFYTVLQTEVRPLHAFEGEQCCLFAAAMFYSRCALDVWVTWVLCMPNQVILRHGHYMLEALLHTTIGL